MAFDSQIRNKLARLVTDARNLLTDEFTKQLQEIFGIQPDGTIIPLEKLTHLTDEQMSVASVLRDRVDHLAAGLTSEKKPVIAAIDRMTREQSFTILNRFAALRMSEERGIVQECVRGAMQSKGFQVYLKVAGYGLGDQYERYKAFLFCIFDEIAVDLGVLFDRFSPVALLFPRESALQGLLEIINNSELKTIWAEDETIGWIYQYFNSVEERKAMREASAAPRNSRELAVRNQFFTPRYVVEFLTDNTLGRIWYEMRKGDTRLKEECRYLVRRPNEVFLGPGEKAPQRDETDENLSQEELLKKPVYIGHRLKKDPRDIRVLDPACGSGHFLLYAFILLLLIYEEAWEDTESSKSEATGKTLQEDYNTLDALRQAVPKLIIEHNLHGIDIDPRCTQIAALALWLRAQKSWKDFGLRAADRPQIDRSNIVTAEPMPGEEDMRREFTESLKPRVLGQLVDVVFEKMKLAGEAGSLLKIEEEIKESIAEAKRQWVKSPEMEQVALFPHLIKNQPRQEKLRFDVKGITDEAFWDRAEESILSSLREYSERAENGRAVRRRLFADDTGKGFAFIDLCRKHYEVILMNPPFGECAESAFEYVSEAIPDWCKNLAAAFLGRNITNLNAGGRIGMVTDRTILIKSSYEDFRVHYALGELNIGPLVDLGWNVLDANVEVSAVVFSESSENDNEQMFIDCRNSISKDSQLQSFVSSIEKIKEKKWLRSRSFLKLPNCAIAHDMPSFIIRWFNAFPALKNGCAKALQGHAIKMDWYGRLRWEVDPSLIGVRSKWSPMYNGGSFSRFYLPLVEIVRWDGDGIFLKAHPSTRWSNADHQQKPGIGYGKRGDILDAHLVPLGHVFTVEGLFVLPNTLSDAWYYLGILNSPLCSVILNFYCGQHKHAGYLDLLPIPVPDENQYKKTVSTVAYDGWVIGRDLDKFNETSPVFVCPCIVTPLGDLQLFQETYRYVTSGQERITELTGRIESAVETIYGLRTEERQEISGSIERALTNSAQPDEESVEQDNGVILSRIVHDSLSHIVGCILGRWDMRVALDRMLAPKLPDPFDPVPVCPPGMLVGSDGLPAKPGGIVSEEWLRARPDANTLPPKGSIKNPTVLDTEYPLRISWNGVLVDDPEHPDNIVRRVQEVMDLLWKNKVHKIEQQACEILGVSDIRDYFREPSAFFQDHLKRYTKSRRKAPIYWPLSTASGSYTLWLYYHRLTDQALFMCVQDFVEPKIKDVERDIERLQKELQSGKKSARDEVEQMMDFRQELIDFRDELLRVAKLPYKPNLNDGVMITACPLWKLFRHNSWSRDLKECWGKFEAGEYDWAHLAYGIWPDRVREVCKRDRSIAIAHGLEDFYQGEIPIKRPKGKRKK